MKFEHGRLEIFGGINRLTAAYVLVGESVTIGSVVSTKMAGDPALMELESRLANTLASVDGFRVDGNMLELSRGEAVVATFRTLD